MSTQRRLKSAYAQTDQIFSLSAWRNFAFLAIVSLYFIAYKSYKGVRATSYHSISENLWPDPFAPFICNKTWLNYSQECKVLAFLVRLSLLTMTNPNQLCDVLLCVLRWLMRPILALNCLLQIEQERSEQESSVGDALALAFRWARFCSASSLGYLKYVS